MAGEELTPMMRQYRRIKTELPEGVILLFRLGDFYEMFFDDARAAAPILGVALTHRAGSPMCGVPYHAIDAYLAKLIRAGKKAAICDQMEDPAQAKGIVRREVTRVVTPGTVTEDEILDAARNNYLAALYSGKGIGLALLDLSTGEFNVESVADTAALTEHLKRYAPSECLIGREARSDPRLQAVCASGAAGTLTDVDDWTLEYDCAYDRLLRHFQVHSLEGYGCEGQAALVCPAGALIHYVSEELRHNVGHIRTLHVRHANEFLTLDESTCVNLDLIPQRGKAQEVTLLGVLNNTQTPMGARLLRAWLVRPLRNAAAIGARLDTVECLTRQRLLLNDLREKLTSVRDLERLIARIGSGRGNARDVKALSGSLVPVPAIRERMEQADNALLRETAARLHPLPELVDLIENAIADAPAAGLKDGGIIRPGYNAELDELRALASEGHAWLAKYQTAEQERTGIKTLKVRHNKIFGFYIEVSKGQTGAVPPEYERRQTLVNAERYITPELKAYEQKIFGAQDRSTAMEFELFCEIRDRVVAQTAVIQETADGLAQLDALASLADRALALGYVRPQILENDALEIRDGRHPVIEQLPDAEQFVPNDTLLDCRRNQIMLITGPNMAGKSTYIRQVALIAIMAHIGSFVPAREAKIGLLDRVFTRVGAGDDLARGRSTFMVEMQETANILNNATANSLIVLDEIGRGTSTFDGISIAWAVAEYLHNTPRVKAKTLFATHYHELTDLSITLNGVKNYTVQVREHGDSVIFLRRIAQGTADKSYGIHVARLAGMPDDVVDRSREILANLEEGELESGVPKLAKRSKKKVSDIPGQLTLF
ncbi:MAG TPA: DNA mismatch repair protein MutS [Kiritimatiellia bacterium]|nr:DNA mismatch repair protein MutS [Kiritimatiellia bacterium]HPS06372.1 DNA mismatch repair protein MutS [Kiritimatiellia bacterium]